MYNYCAVWCCEIHCWDHKNREVILKAWEENYSNNRKRKPWRTDNENVHAVTLRFFLKYRGMNVLVTGPMIQTTAKEMAKQDAFWKFSGKQRMAWINPENDTLTFDSYLGSQPGQKYKWLKTGRQKCTR